MWNLFKSKRNKTNSIELERNKTNSDEIGSLVRSQDVFKTNLIAGKSSQEIIAESIPDQPMRQSYAMDSNDCGNNAVPTKTMGGFCLSGERVPSNVMNYYANSGFIGFQACAIMGQHWLIDSACTIPAEDASRNGWQVTFNDGLAASEELISAIHEFDVKFKAKKNIVEFTKFKRLFGFRVAIFVVESDDPQYYEKPFNIDGVTPKSYKGISQVDPYWMTPIMDDSAVANPANIDFYEPTWWQIGGQKYHKSHLVIVRHSEAADIIKPSYLYGGVSLPQQIFERVYAAERTANEAPLLTMTKRMNVQKVDLSRVFSDPEKFFSRLQEQTVLRDNYGVKLIDEDDDYFQHETSLADLDSVIMTQFQLVAAIAGVPATKLLGTSPKGFNATGEHEIDSYNATLAKLQSHDMQPLLERHYQILMRSEFSELGDVAIQIVWNPLDEPTEKERAETNNLKADYYGKLFNTGAVSGEDISKAVVSDENSGFSAVNADDDEPFNDDITE